VTLLDAFAVIALLRDEPAAASVRQLLTEDDASMTALGIAEVVDHLVRFAGASEDDAVLDVAQLGLAAAVVTDDSIALHAGLLRARHYDRRARDVSLADCVLAASARVEPTRTCSTCARPKAFEYFRCPTRWVRRGAGPEERLRGAARLICFGLTAAWPSGLGKGLQSPVHRFDSGRRLQSNPIS
jgi:PIN domain nuclease of toxin-antitoxin system